MSMAGEETMAGEKVKTFTDRNGRTWQAHGPRPYFVRCKTDRRFGSLDAARAYARTVEGHYSMFFEFAPGTGAPIESSLRGDS